MLREKVKKISLGIMLAIFVLMTTVGSTLMVLPARAQGSVIVAGSVPDTTNKVFEAITQAIKIAVLNASLQAVSYFTRKFAYDSAVWLASGGKGQSAFAQSSSFGDYLKQTGDAAVGAGIDALGTAFGLNLCHIPDLRLDLMLRIGLGLNYGYGAPPKPNCTLSDFRKNWSLSNFNSMYGAGSIENRFNASFEADQSDLGIYLGASAKLDEMQSTAEKGATLQRTEDQGAIGFTDLISGNIKTPGAVMMNDIKNQSPSEQKKTENQQIGSAFSAGTYQILPSTLSVFLNTLVGQMMENYKTKGMFPFGLGYSSGGASGVGNFAGQGPTGAVGGRVAAEQIFMDYQVAPVKSVDNYTILARFSSCPDNPAPDNCVADQDLVNAVQEASYGKPITIKEALERQILDGNKTLINPLRKTENADKNCYKSAYCYRNVQMLRKARILPLGFEIAAYLSDPDHPWTLKKVVDGYNDCSFNKDQFGNVVGVNYDPAGHPFCHLIDPDWILKVPDTRCNDMSIGPAPMASGIPSRGEECTDFSSCIQYNGDKCVAYGYCTREKNVWKFAAGTCDAQYNSCRVFQDSTGNQVGYLYRTLDTSSCDAESVGCRAYSVNQNAQHRWVADTSLYFNKKLSTSCPAHSAGCTAFNFANNPTGTTGDLFLRQAPDYLNCYDIDNQTLGIQWPMTASDLVRLSPQPDCANYAKPCIPDEVDCNWYTPVNSAGQSLPSERLPGKYTPGTDECNAVCEGYAAYREMPSAFSTGQDIAYIIPQSANHGCQASDEGCSSFTNLGTTVGGLEKVEYYSYLRSCILPDPAKQKTFYTYTGSIANGYQLQVYVLQEDKDGNSDAAGKVGGPEYFYRTRADLDNYRLGCNEAVYRSGSDPDCRQFNDAAGQIYYRFLSQTVVVSDQCTPYRLNTTELATDRNIVQADCVAPKGVWQVTNGQGHCGVCFQNGEYKSDGYCYYYGLPEGVVSSGESSSVCSASVNTCRKYKGSRGNNVEISLFADFDKYETDLSQWRASNGGNVAVSPESTHLGEHSLGFTGPVRGQLVRSNLDLQPYESYEVSFWAKGNIGDANGQVGNLTVALSNDAITPIGTVGISDIWQYYHFNSTVLLGSTSSTALTFTIGQAGRLFLDNVRVMRLNDVKYLVKNSLKVDPACDSDLTDNLPGQALGCTKYLDNQNKEKYLTNFSYLCREGAIGCTALLDTHNTLDTTQEKIYNVWVPSANQDIMKRFLGLTANPCVVPTGASGCYLSAPIVGHTPAEIINAGGVLVTSTIDIAPDTPANSPIYLVASPDEPMNCAPSSIGCVEVGAQIATPNGWQFVTTTIQNDPAQYGSGQVGENSILCQSESLGCDAFNSKNGNVYFKDPTLINQKICTYFPEVKINSVSYSGWFWKGVGVCANNNNKYCIADEDCPNSTCKNIDAIPCYPSYLQGGASYGLWSFGDKGKYKNFVGACPVEQDNCKEFIDHDDMNRAYYLIADEKLTAGDCGSGVSRREGCILLDDTGQPNKLYSTRLTYKASENKDYQSVPAVTSPNVSENDSNIVVKVTRDRECSEWLYPSIIHPTADGSQNKSYALGVCNKAQKGLGFVSQCLHDISNNWQGKGEFMDAAKYVRRSVAWGDSDYSGFSLPNSYQIADLVPFATSSGSQYFLVYQGSCVSAPGRPVNCPCQNAADEGKRCGADNNNDGTLDGWCVNKKCLYPANGISNPKITSFSGNVEGLSCRAYPEVDSPFPQTVTASTNALNTFKKGFENVHVCESATDCSCSYNKVTYGPGSEVTKYYGLDERVLTEIPNPYYVEAQNGDAQSGLESYKEKSLIKFEGGTGYCVERDMRRKINGTDDNSCLTWYPVDFPAGVEDISAFNNKASYQISGDRYVCLRNYPISPVIFPANLRDPDPNMCVDNGGGSFNCFIDGGKANNFIGLPTAEDPYAKKYNLFHVNEGAAQGGCNQGGVPSCFTSFIIETDGGWIGDRIPVISTKYQIDTGGNRIHQKGIYVPLRYVDVFGEAPPAGRQEYFSRNEISQIDIYTDNHRNDPNQNDTNSAEFFANIITFFPLATNEANMGDAWKHSGKGGVVDGEIKDDKYFHFTQQKNGEQPFGNGVSSLKYMEYASYVGNFIQGMTFFGDSFPSLDAIGRPLGQKADATGFLVRLVFDDQDRLRGAWLHVYNNNQMDATIGFFFVIHFTPGPCQMIGQVSKSGEAKPVTWRLKSGSVNVGTLSRNIGGREEGMMFSPYGLVDAGWDKQSKIMSNPFSLSAYENIDGDSKGQFYNDNFYSVPPESDPPGSFNFKAGVPIEVTGNLGERDGDMAFYTRQDSPYKDFLSSMFAKIYNGKVKILNNNSYLENGAQPTITDAASPLYSREKNEQAALAKPFIHYVPQIASVNMWSCNSPDDKIGCGLAKLGNFTVNSTDNEDVVIEGSSAVSLRFFAWAGAAQMPLRRFEVDFGNGTMPYVSSNDSQSNYKPYCEEAGKHCADDLNLPCMDNAFCTALQKGNCVVNGNNDQEAPFGSEDGSGCKAQYYTVYGQYSCDATALYSGSAQAFVWDDTIASGLKYDPNRFGGGHLAVMRTNPDPAKPWEILLTPKEIRNYGLTDGSVVCAYRPKVQVMDNWGWCSGRCTHGEYQLQGGSIIPTIDRFDNGCYQEIPIIGFPTVFDQCDIASRNNKQKISSYIPFGGYGSEKNVIVIPVQ